ncbi:MAG: hypothetical protein ACJAWG_003282 [Candidatus Azotimanducaceae bacterium]|jgi:hypothetical protein
MKKKNRKISVPISNVLGALVLWGFVSSNVVASNPRETARTYSVNDVVESIESYKLDLNESDLLEVHAEQIRTVVLIQQARLALIKGDRAEFDDLVTKMVVYANSFPDGSTEWFPAAFASILSSAIELGWSLANESTLELYRISTVPPSDQLYRIHNKISYAFAVGNIQSLISSVEKLPPITEASNSWERFVRGLADYRHYLLSGDKAKLRGAITLFESILIDTSVVSSDGVADKPRLFDARVRLQLANAYLTQGEAAVAQDKQVSLEHASTIWNAMNYPALIIDHPALWGAHMHLYFEILSVSLQITEYEASEKDEKHREVAYRRDEAYFLASRYR